MSDLEVVQDFLSKSGDKKPTRAVVLAARRLANKYARLNQAASVNLSPYMLSLLRLDRDGNVRK